MRLLWPAPEDEVVAAFLRAEADDIGRHQAPILQRLDPDQEPLDTLRRTNLSDPSQNAYLRGCWRAAWLWPRGRDVRRVPTTVEWHRAALPRDELLEVR